MHISKLLDVDQLALEIESKYVTERFHPDFPELCIYNYTDICSYKPYWTDITRKTRGLIVNTSTGEIVARPFEKFFNYGQQGAVQLDLDAPVVGAYDKMDGSLGVAYLLPNGVVQIATRGSFESDQAIHASKWIHEPENAKMLTFIKAELSSGCTPLFEIIFPENRIVLDYGSDDKLEYLGSVDTYAGSFYPAGDLLVGNEFLTLREILKFPDRKNKEGLVVWVNVFTAIKIKQQDYVELHRIVSSLSQKEVWRQLSAGTYDDFVVQLPDEFFAWSDSTATTLREQVSAITHAAVEFYMELISQGLKERKDQASWVSGNVTGFYKGLVFLLLDSKDITPSVWRLVEPVGANPMKIIVE
jgi:RNA ligase